MIYLYILLILLILVTLWGCYVVYKSVKAIHEILLTTMQQEVKDEVTEISAEAKKVITDFLAKNDLDINA